MKNSRFIFTIDKPTKNYVSEVARKSGVSTSKVINKIIQDHASDRQFDGIVQNPKSDSNLTNHRRLNSYSTPDLTQILSKQNFLELLSNDDVDFLIYSLDGYINAMNFVDDQVIIIYAKVLKHRGYLTKAISILSSIEDEYNIEKHLLLLSIYISTGDIPKANTHLLHCTELLNLFSHNLKKYRNDYLVLKAELIWINEGVLKAREFVKKCLVNSQQFDENVLGKLYCLEGEFLRDKGNYSAAKTSYITALNLLKNYPFEGSYIARTNKGLGSIYKNHGNYVTSSKYIFNALDISKKFADKITESSVLASIGSLYLVQNKDELGIKMLQEKADIGRRANSIREIFYANYELGMATVEKGDYKTARDSLEDIMSIGSKFKRRYYIDMWRGLLRSFEDFDDGIKIIQKSKSEAREADEEKKIYLADYLIAASCLNKAGQEKKGENILKVLMNNTSTSKQLKRNAQILLKYPKVIKSI